MMKIYLDMDGVLTNFNKKFEELFGEFGPDRSVGRKHFLKHWSSFIEQKAFEDLEILPGAVAILDKISNLTVDVEILSSSGGPEFHDEVERQKKVWLKNNGINFKANIVPGSDKKAAYARTNTLLIDDTEYVIDSFRKAGGMVIHHDHLFIDITLKSIEEHYARNH